MQTNSYALSTKCARCSLGQVVIAELSRARSTMNKKILVNYPFEKSEFFFYRWSYFEIRADLGSLVSFSFLVVCRFWRIVKLGSFNNY